MFSVELSALGRERCSQVKDEGKRKQGKRLAKRERMVGSESCLFRELSSDNRTRPWRYSWLLRCVTI